MPPSIPLSSENETHSAWSPLRHKVFRVLWLATIASNIGTWMHDVGAGWLMTSLSTSPLMVALVQAATTLPIVLLVLPAGVLADILDRRRYLIWVQSWMLLVAAGLGFCTLTGMTTSWLLLILTFMLGCGSAMSLLAWSAIAPELVAKKELQAAITLNGLGINVSRAIGPAMAGLLIAALGPASVFLLNAASFLGVLIVLFIWKREYRTCVGLGAILSAILLPRLRRYFDSDHSIRWASLSYCAILVGLATLNNVYLLGMLMLLTGASWIIVCPLCK